MPLILETFPVALECSTLVFRVLKPSWLDDGEIVSQAFILREIEEGVFETGLSVLNNIDNALKVLQKPKVVVSLHVGKIRDLGPVLMLDLDVIPDDEPDPKIDVNNITHAEIRGMPPPNSIENALIAERVATALIGLTKNRDFAWERPIT